ncbi:uncharacterized protein LOC143367213 [Andrena cerasifolii]|uniref:uncharacterized protein LOC143367213 n=1 Tax=Andrena cerasifolii TaxID=2819439 RepID=UPI0040380B95
MEDRSIRMDNRLAELIAKTIIELFPTEVLTTYYIPPVLKRNSPTNQSIPARGKLVSCYRNKKFQNKKLQTKLVAEARKDASFQAESLCDEVTKESNKWLLANRAPWKLVREHWTVTSKLRMQEVQKIKDSNLARILGDWKLYDHPQGLNLSNINLDKKAWFEFFESLKEYSNISSKDETANMYMEQMCSRELKDDTKVVISLLLIAHLYPPKQMKKLNKKAFKPSIGVSKDSIIKFATIPGDVTRIQKEVQERASTSKLTIQPYILIVGSIENIEDIYICMDEVLYKVSEAIQGIDICFKIFHVFQLVYPFASEHIWLLIQKGIYQFDTPFDKDIVSIQHVLHKLKEKNTAKRTQVSSEQTGIDDAETQQTLGYIESTEC